MGLARKLSRPLARPLTRPLTAAGVVPYGPLPTPNRYVSNSASNGYALGVNSGAAGSKSAPWLTLDYALANATTGDVIQINGRPESPLIYRAATFYNLANKTLTIQAEWRHGVILEAADTQTRIINLAPSGAGPSRTLICYGLIFDGRANTQRGMSIGSTTPNLGVFANVELYDCRVTRVTGRAVHTVSQKSTNVTIRRLMLDTPTNASLIHVDSAQEGVIDIDGVILTGCTATASACAVVRSERVTGGSGMTAAVKNVVGALTNTAGSTDVHGIMLGNITAPVIENCAVTITGAGGGWLYRTYSNSATMDANNAIIRNNAGHNGNDSGYIIFVGTDAAGAGDNNHNNAQVYGNNVSANPAAASPIHGLMLGYGIGGHVHDNTVSGAALAQIAKQQTGDWLFENNVITNCASQAQRSKGSVGDPAGGFRNNHITSTPAFPCVMAQADSNDAPVTASSNVPFEDNTYVIGGAPTKVNTVATGSTAPFARNTYEINVALGADPFQYGATLYADYPAWKAAIEPTALP